MQPVFRARSLSWHADLLCRDSIGTGSVTIRPRRERRRLTQRTQPVPRPSTAPWPCQRPQDLSAPGTWTRRPWKESRTIPLAATLGSKIRPQAPPASGALWHCLASLVRESGRRESLDATVAESHNCHVGWLEDMTPGTTLTAEARQIIVTAMLAFSDHQRRVMIQAGV